MNNLLNNQRNMNNLLNNRRNMNDLLNNQRNPIKEAIKVYLQARRENINNDDAICFAVFAGGLEVFNNLLSNYQYALLGDSKINSEQ